MAISLRDGGATMLSVYAQRRLESVNRRYLQCLRSLEVIRKLNRPSKARKPRLNGAGRSAPAGESQPAPFRNAAQASELAPAI